MFVPFVPINLSSFLSVVVISQFHFAMNQSSLTYFYPFLPKFSNVHYKPFFLLIFFRILKLFFILLRLLFSYRPLYFHVQIFIMIICKNSKTKKDNISQRFKSYCIIIRAVHIVIICNINLFKSLPYLWLLETFRTHYELKFVLVFNMLLIKCLFLWKLN